MTYGRRVESQRLYSGARCEALQTPRQLRARDLAPAPRSDL